MGISTPDASPGFSDAYLFRCIEQCCGEDGRIVYSEAVKDLIARYSGGRTVSQIPPASRILFTIELAVLTGRAVPDVLPLDYLTVATSVDLPHPRPLTKIHTFNPETGEVDTTPNAKAEFFSWRRIPTNDLEDIERVILAMTQFECVIQGWLLDGVDPKRARRRKNGENVQTIEYADPLSNQKIVSTVGEPATLGDRPQWFLWLDFDDAKNPAAFDPIVDIHRTAEYVRARLPEPFRNARMLGELTSSAGVPNKDKHPWGISFRCVFRLSRPLTSAQQHAWLVEQLNIQAPLDRNIYSPEREIYAAPPVFIGMADPVTRRTVIIEGDDAVEVPDAIKVSAKKSRGRQVPAGEYVYDKEAARHEISIARARDAFDRKLLKYDEGIPAGDRHRAMFDIAQAPFWFTDDIELVTEWCLEEALPLLEGIKYGPEDFQKEVLNAYNARLADHTLASRAWQPASSLFLKEKTDD